MGKEKVGGPGSPDRAAMAKAAAEAAARAAAKKGGTPEQKQKVSKSAQRALDSQKQVEKGSVKEKAKAMDAARARREAPSPTSAHVDKKARAASPPPPPATKGGRPIQARIIQPKKEVTTILYGLQGTAGTRASTWDRVIKSVIQQAADAVPKGRLKKKEPQQMAKILTDNMSNFIGVIKTVVEETLIATMGELQAKEPKPSLPESQMTLRAFNKEAFKTVIGSRISILVGDSPTEKQIAAFTALAESIAGNLISTIPTQATQLGIDSLAEKI